MFKNYIKIAFRNLWKHKGYTAIHIFGLAIGLACCVLILLFVQHELSYDRYHANAENIYRLERDINFQDIHSVYPVTSHPYGPTLQNEFPEVLQAVRIWPSDTDYLDKNHQYNRGYFIYADANVFEVFSWPLLIGDPQTALKEPFTIVITESLAKRYFPDSDPIGQTLTMQWGEDYDYKVTGVMKDVPRNSHFTFDAIASYTSLYSILGEEQMAIWFNHNIYTYLMLRDGYDPASLEAKLPAFQEKYMGNPARELMGRDVNINDYIKLKLKPLPDIHLYSNLEHEIQPNGDINTVYIFSAIALLILLIACINFMNLATARSMERAKEVGLRKVVGAERTRLIFQFLSESIIMTMLSLIIAVGIIELLLPTFNSLTNNEFSIRYFDNPLAILGFIGIVLLVGITAGGYPAFYLSAFQPVTVLKGQFKSNTKGAGLRKTLVITQFAISIGLIISTAVVMKQLEYLRNKKLGFDKEQVVVIPIHDANLKPARAQTLQQELARYPAVVSVGSGSKIPGNRRFSDTMFRKSHTGEALEDMVNVQYFFVSHDYIPTLGIEMAAGRNFSREFPTDTSGGYIINEAAVAHLGFQSAEEAVGKEFAMAKTVNPLTFREGQIVGVTKNFHFKSLRHKIEPVVMRLDPRSYRYILVRIRPESIPQTLAFLEEKTRQFSPTYPFEYFFQDEFFDNLYRSEDRLQEIFGYFTFLAIFVACLGLFGLAAYTAEQRRKEIGIRKILGATVPNMIFLLSSEFLKLVLIANFLAWPLAYVAMNNWLNDFAYRIAIGWQVFALAGGLALVIALLTVSWQALKSALANPVESLRYE